MKKKKSGKKKRRKSVLGYVFLFILFSVVILGGIIGKVYLDVKQAYDSIHESVPKDTRLIPKLNRTEDEIAEGKPFSVLILGIDTGDFGRTDVGRSDTIMVATVNPQKKETLLVSIPRDTYTEIIGKQFEDKINHAYAFGGAAMAMDTTENLLDIPINYYIWLNMKGMADLVDVLGGVTVKNSIEFTHGDFNYTLGDLSMNGPEALHYTRMRKEDPRGDYGRQDRQRLVLQAMSKKLLNMSSVTKYQSILNVLGENMRTNLTIEEMRELERQYRPALVTIKQDFIQGEGAMIDGGSYQLIPEAELSRVQKELEESLKK